MKKYDTIVVGSGISGLTMSLFLAMNGQKVMLLEKNPCVGGSIARFYKGRIPFDIGFHFTGGLQEDGILHNILTILGIVDKIEPIFLSEDNASCFIFETEGKAYTIPYGMEKVVDRIKTYFPNETEAVEKYFRMARHVCDNTPFMNFGNFPTHYPQLDEDFVTLDDVLRGLTSNPLLRGLLSGYAMCYGVKPSEISFANHSRMTMNFYESLAYVRGGGDAFVHALKERIEEFDGEVCCGQTIVDLADIRNNKVGRFVLNTGEEVTADHCIFTIHPHEILKVLPLKILKKAFLDRVMSFEPSVGFFSVFAMLGSDAAESGRRSTIASLFPHCDINKLLDPEYKGKRGLVVLKSVEEQRPGNAWPLHILAIAFPDETAQWKESRTGHRPSEYLAYKKANVETITEHVFEAFPEYKGHLHPVDSATMLTFRDYLNSPEGSAYGIKQKMGQYNLIGKLPLRNLYAAGQSAGLPGLVGAMMSSLIVGKAIVGKEKYEGFVNKRYGVK